MAKIPLTLKISKEAHAALKAGQGTMLINLFMENFLVKNRVNQLHTAKLLN
jgi:hypothetical protein